MARVAGPLSRRGVCKSVSRMTRIFLVAMLTFLGVRAEAQSPVSLKWTETWQPGYSPNNPVAIAADPAGGVIAVGESGDQPLAIKYDTNGNTVWRNWLTSQNVFMGSTAVAVAADASGDVFVLSGLNVTFTRQGNLFSNVPDTALAKYNAEGVRQWVDFSTVNTPAVGLAVTPDGEAYVLSWTQLQNGPGVVTAKYDANGEQLWQAVEPIATATVGEALEGGPVAIRLDGLGNVYTAANNGLAGAIFRYDANGNLLNTIGGGTLGLIRKYQVDAAGNSYVLGGAASSQDRLVAKFLPDGTLVWKNDLGPQLSEPVDQACCAVIDDTLKDIGVDLAGDVFTLQDEPSIAATPSGWDMVILKFSASGTREWAERFNTAGAAHTDQDRAVAMAVSDEGDSYITGFPNSGPGGTITAKFNSTGTQVWERPLGIQNGGSIAIALGTNGQVFVESAGGPTGLAWFTTDYGQE